MEHVPDPPLDPPTSLHPDKLCPYCAFESPSSDDIASHLIDDHAWDYQRALLWLRDQVEREHCQCPECRYYDAEILK